MFFSHFLRTYKTVLAFFFLLITLKVLSQTHTPYQRDYLAKSPEVANFDKYGDIAVSLFTGAANINVPIYTLRDLDENVSIGLSYNTSGLKPNQHHGWVGLGWNLNVGGSITRIKRGDYDEKLFTSGEIPASGQTGYMENFQLLNPSNSGTSWDGSAIITEKICEGCTVSLQNREADLEPDEFVFNFQGHSGSIILNHQGNWVFRTNNAEAFELENSIKPIFAEDYRVDRVSKTYTNTNPTDIMKQIRKQKRVIIGFIIKTNDGTEYEFGGDYAAIDFTYELTLDKAFKEIWPTTWHLKSIKPVSGKDVSFVYVKNEFNIVANRVLTQGFSNTDIGGNSVSLSSDNGSGELVYSLIDASYLSEIQTPFESIKFEKIKLVDLADYDLSTISKEEWIDKFGVDKDLAQWFKLDAIKIYDKSDLSTAYKSFKFEYDVSMSNRLQLIKVNRINVDDNNDKILVSEFEYKNTPYHLPQYNDVEGKVDHWGFFNNKNVILNTINDAAFSICRQPDATFMGAEMITKIKYPTGGYTEFVFEPHDYSAKVKKSEPSSTTLNTPYGIESVNPMLIAGGLRISQIKNVDGPTTRIKSYFYKKNYEINGTQSSGVLGGEPKYFDSMEGTIGAATFGSYYLNDQSLNPLNETNNSPVTYSEVVEKYEDGSFVINKFSNNDVDLYRNRIAIKIGTSFPLSISGVRNFTDPVIDMESLRGKLLELKKYNSSYQLVAKNKFEYTDNVFDNQAIRAIYTREKVILPAINFTNNPNNKIIERRAVSYLIHTTPILLKKKTDYLYESRPTGSEMVTTTEYEYDAYLNITKEKVTGTDTYSDITTTYKYAYDPDNITAINPTVSETTTGNKQKMLTAFMVGIPLVTINSYGKGSKVEFNDFGGKMLPWIFYDINTGAQDEKSRVVSYGLYGLPHEIQNFGFPKQTFNWDTKGLLTSKVYGSSAFPTHVLTWTFSYLSGKRSRLIDVATDENGLKNKFTFDGFQRLLMSQNRFNGSDAAPSNVQVKTEYIYHYTTGAMDNNYIQTTTKYADGYPGNTITPLLPQMVAKQFVDGLGRPFMSYRKDYTQDATLKHQKTYMTYDPLGRPDKSYQPFGSDSEDVHASDATTLALTTTKFVQSTYEASPLSRPLEQIMEDKKKVTMRYSTNIGTEVKKFTATSSTAFNTPPTVTQSNTYAANTLSKTTVWNENGSELLTPTIDPYTIKTGRTDVFKDKLGRVILTRKFVNSTFDAVDTYNVYDNFGNLVMVIPPGAENGGTIMTELTFQYIYDNQNRLRGKKVPNADWQYFYYDNHDLMVLTQDGNMRGSTSPAGTKYLGTEYDILGRIVKTGFISISGDPSVYLATNTVTIDDNTYLTKNVYYQNKNWLKFTYNRVLTASNVTPPKATLYTEYDQVRPNLYNYKGFPYWVNQENLFGIDEMNQDYNGAGKPTYSNRYSFVGYEANYSDFFRTWEVHKYDNSLRHKESSHQFSNVLTGNLQTIDQLNQFTYDVQDRLKRKDIGRSMAYGNKYLQNTNYEYNSRGWLTNINEDPFFFAGSPYDYPIFNCTDNDKNVANNTAYTNNALTFPQAQTNPLEDNPDLFGEVIRYDDPENGIPNGKDASGNNRTTTPRQYNGNISQIRWQVAGREMQIYSYNYDNLDRLTEANYADWHTGSSGAKGWGTPFASDNKYQEMINYDLRGNITKLNRNGLTGNMAQATNSNLLYGCFGPIDNLTYNYDPLDKNKLISISDAIPKTVGTTGFFQKSTSSTAYVYDLNGNLIKDANKQIWGIEYNYLNLPVRITFAREVTSGQMTQLQFIGVIEFMYSASGVKLQKRVSTSIDPGMGDVLAWSITNYSNGAEYDGDNNLVRLQHTEGAIAKNNEGQFQYEYVLRDHLGNTRVTFSDAGDDGILVASDIKQINHYYPFGLNMDGPGFGTGGANKYQFNGIELNTEFGLNINTAFFRGYDAAVGRWWQVDPKPSFGESVYAGMGNNPIRYSDMLGDTIRGNNEQSAQRLLGIIFRTFARETPGGMSTASLFKLGKDGKTFQSISRKDFYKATAGLSKDARALATGYFNAINRDRIHTVEVLKRGENISTLGGKIHGATTTTKFDFDNSGGRVLGYTENGFQNPDKQDYSIIIMDSKYAQSEELVAHEVLGHGDNHANAGIGTSESGVRSVQATNVYRRAVGNTQLRSLDGFHGDPNRLGQPDYRESAYGYPPNMIFPIYSPD